MKKWMSQTGVPIVLSTALAIGAGGTPLYAMTVTEVIEAVKVLPTVEEVQEMPEEEQKALYEKLQEVWIAYEAFSEEDKQQLEEVKEVENLLEWFNNAQTMPLEGEEIEFEGNQDLKWSLADGTLTITGKGIMPALYNPPWKEQKNQIKNVVIEEGVTSIGANAFQWCSSLTSIELPTSLNTIGYSAFQGCSSLTSIDLPNSLTTIDSIAFAGCSNLTSIELPDQITSIEANTFNGCSGLTSIKLPANLTSIEDGVFWDCSGLTSIELPANLNTIGANAFYGCSDLRSIKLPNSLNTIGANAFYNCSGLTSIKIPAGIESIAYYAFMGCSSLTSVELPANLTSIEDGAFYNCSGLTSVELPANLTSIGNGAFIGCSSLTSVELPERLTSIGVEAFLECSKLETLVFKNPIPPKLGESAFDNISTSLKIYIPSDAKVEDYKKVGLPEEKIYQPIGNSDIYCQFLNNTVMISGTGAMPDLESYPWDSQKATISRVVVEEGVTSIGDGAFNGCKELTSVKLPTNLQSIGESAFSGNSNLKEVTFEGDAPTLGHNVFEGCSTDLTIHIPEDATGYTEGGNWPVSHILYKLNVFTHEGGTMEPLKPFAKAGETITLMPKANDGYRFKEWKVQPNVTITDNTFTMPADHMTIEPIFVKLYSITLKNEMGGVQSTVKASTKKGHKLR